MPRSLVILAALILAAAALFTGAFLMASRFSSQQLCRPTDDLDWLKTEFRLGPAEMEHVRQLHEGYLPVCQGYCDEIAAQRRELNSLVGAGQGTSAEAVECLEKIARLRARCQAAMLEHFEAVSQAMPPDQGRRYLEEMRRLTLGAHEQIEESMSGGAADGHVHH